ncbi:MAG TPA: transcriptional regulator [Solibacterales bacterium]|nr:transcriptional regulator [Bryobacterales bacterium]
MAPIPSGSELGILEILWSAGPRTVREVHDALARDTTYTSTLKQMQVMHEKGLLVRSERFRSHLYEPAAGRAEIRCRIAAEVMRRVFGGSAKDLVMGALGAQRPSRKEIREIRRLLDEYEQGRR